MIAHKISDRPGSFSPLLQLATRWPVRWPSGLPARQAEERMPNKMAQNMNLTRASAALRTGLESARKREGAEDAKWDERSAGKPVAAICHAPWSVVEAGEAGGRTMTSWPSLRTDIWNAGAGARSAGPAPGWAG